MLPPEFGKHIFIGAFLFRQSCRVRVTGKTKFLIPEYNRIGVFRNG